MPAASRGEFRHKVREEKMSHDERELAIAAGRLGYTARGVVFLLIGGISDPRGQGSVLIAARYRQMVP